MKEVNSELMPLVRMTVPDKWRVKPICQWPANCHLFDSWILLFGFIPVDKHSICFDIIEEDVGFSEASTSFANHSWKHRRDVAETPTGCRVTDTVEFEPRLALVGPIAKVLYRLIFAHRHRHLGARYG